MTLKKWQSTYQNNHLRLMRVHIGFIIFWCVLTVIFCGLAFIFPHKEISLLKRMVRVLLIISPIFILHGLLAYGAFNKIELSRKISEAFFSIMLLSGSKCRELISFHFLPKTVWKQPE